MSTPNTAAAAATPAKIQVTRAVKEDVNGVMYPAKGTGARIVWDAADSAFNKGTDSSTVIDHLTSSTTMTRGTISSQLTYWRKATGKELAKRASTAKAEKLAAKAEAKAKREAESAAKKAAKEQEQAKKAAEKLAKLQAQAAKLQESQAAAPAAKPAEKKAA